MELLIDNFTAILPVTCNADCGFCPEKEMAEKAKKDQWIENLVKHINATRHMGYDHVSLTGGEPSLDPRLLKETITAIHERTWVRKVGMTTNGQFMESKDKILKFLDAITKNGACLLDFLNISRHAFTTPENNDIMRVSYQHTLRDIVNFRQVLPRELSFRLNMVITETTDVNRLFNEAEALYRTLTDAYVGIAFRTDYEMIIDRAQGLVPEKIMAEYVKVFGAVEEIGGCPTCITYQSPTRFNYTLKGANFEPTDKDKVWREFIQHQDGVLYYDWTRNKPVDLKEIGYIDPNSLLGESVISPVDLLFSIGLNHRQPIQSASVRQQANNFIIRQPLDLLNVQVTPHIGSCGGVNPTVNSGSCGGGRGGSCGGRVSPPSCGSANRTSCG